MSLGAFTSSASSAGGSLGLGYVTDSPADIEAEKRVLGAILLEPHRYSEVTLSPDDFSLDIHQRIYRTMGKLAVEGIEIDAATVLHVLGDQAMLLDGPYLSSLTDGRIRGRNIAFHAQIIRDMAVRRRAAYRLEGLHMLANTPGVKLPDFERAADAFIWSLRNDPGYIRGIRRLADVPDIFSVESDEISYVVPEILPRGVLVLCTGEPGVGKSIFTQKLAVSCALGNRFLGRQCMRLPCLILDRENPLTLVRHRFDLLGGGPVPELHHWGAWLPEPPPPIGDPRLLEIAKEERPLIIFDSFVRFHEADENDASEMRQVMAQLRRLVDAGATVILLHHRAKAQESKFRGSSDILAAVDMAYVLEGDGAQLKLTRFKSRFSGPRIFRIDVDFSEGKMEIAESQADPDDAKCAECLLKLISERPGMSARALWDLVRDSGLNTSARMTRNRVDRVLAEQNGRLWRSEPGPRGATLYSPIERQMQNTVPVPQHL